MYSIIPPPYSGVGNNRFTVTFDYVNILSYKSLFCQIIFIQGGILMKKNFIIGFICGALVCGAAGALASDAWQNISVLPNTIKVVVNGKEIQADNFLYNDTTYLPIRAVGEALGNDIQYDPETGTAVISNEAATPTPTPAPVANKNLEPLPDVPIKTVDGVDYVDNWDIEKMLDDIGLGQYIFSSTDFFDGSDYSKASLLKDIPHHPTDNTLILYDYYISTIIPVINNLR